MAEKKPHINIVFIGHVDAGKSTTVGRLLYDSGNIDEQTMRKLKEKAESLGKKGFEFAFVMDNLKEEQERGVTIDLAHKRFDTNKFYFTIIDAPGHKDFIKNMITGASQADVGVLVVAATDTEVMPQTREHVFLAKTLGVGQLLVCINKMDAVKYDEKKFNEVKDRISTLVKSVGYKPETVPFLAVASLVGDNVAKKSANMAWYKGATLLESFDQLKEPEKPTNLPLRLPIQDVYNITGIGEGEVKTIEMHHEQMTEAKPGDNVGFNVRGFGKKDIARGDVVGHTSNVPTIATEFTAQLVVLNHPTVITVGYTPVFHIHTAQVACQFVSLEKKLNPATGEVVAEKPDFIKNGDAAIVKLKPVQPLCIEKQKEIPHMARFAIRDSGATVAAGMCIDLVKK